LTSVDKYEKAFHVVFLLVLFSCNGTEGKVHVEKKERSIKRFDSFMFSIEPGWSNEDSRDVEINNDGTAYLRLRDDREIRENFKGTLDSQNLRQVFILIDSMHVEALDSVYQDYFDGAYYSLCIKNERGEVRTKGMDFPDEVRNLLMEVVEIVERQKMMKSSNRHFNTAKDVLIPPPPGIIEPNELLDSLYNL
jgi:hypothetical protein